MPNSQAYGDAYLILYAQHRLFCREIYFQAGPIFLGRVESCVLCESNQLSCSCLFFRETFLFLLVFVLPPWAMFLLTFTNSQTFFFFF